MRFGDVDDLRALSIRLVTPANHPLKRGHVMLMKSNMCTDSKFILNIRINTQQTKVTAHLHSLLRLTITNVSHAFSNLDIYFPHI